jgi:drug/metabolite transporter (DMT)-like permease
MNTLRSPSPTRGYLITFVATAIWSTTAIFVRYLSTRYQVPPLVLAFWRALVLSGALCGVLAVVAPRLLHPGRQHVPFLVAYGFSLAVINALWTVSVVLNGAAVGAVLNHSAPAFTALVGWRLWGERLNPQKIGAIVLCIVGVAFTSGAYDLAAWQVNPVGVAVGLATGAGFAAYSLLGELSSRRGINPWTATLYSFALGAAFLLFVQRPSTILWLSRPLAAGPDGWRDAALGWGTLVLLAVGPTLTGYGLYTVGLTHLPASTASLIATLEPVITGTCALVFLGERPTPPQLWGACLILTGVVLLRLSERVNNRAGVRLRARQPRPQRVDQKP